MSRVHPDYPPRARLEWAIASARIVLAAGAMFAVWFDPFTPAIDSVLAAYLVDSLVVMALVWSPVRFAPSWSVVVHAGDLILVVVLMSIQGPRSPFFIYFVFSVVSGALRWNLPGALWTTAAALSAYVGISLTAGISPAFGYQFIIRCVQLTVAAAMVGYLTAYYSRIQREVLGLAAWPRRIPGDASDVVADVLERATDILTAPRVLLIWEEPDEEYVNLAWRDDGRLQWVREPANTYFPIVSEPLKRENFQAYDTADSHGRIRVWSGDRFREKRGPAVNEALRLRFGMRAVQSCRFDGELVHGRFFWLYRRRMRIDDLVMGELVAVLAAARLDAVYSLARLRDSAGLRERMRVARDLHDRILQALAGLGLQLVVARRMIERDGDAAAQKMEDIQQQFERVEIDMRSFIRRLRPMHAGTSLQRSERLEERCETLQRRVEAQWPAMVDMELSIGDRPMPDELMDQVFLIVQEGLLNAARHADASSIRVSVRVLDEELRVEISDDGKGFPFSGSYDLAALNGMRAGPLTLKERVTELHGALQLESSRAGARVVITLPLAQAMS